MMLLKLLQRQILTRIVLVFLVLSTSMLSVPTVSKLDAAGVTYSFTNAGATGNTGPTQSMIDTAYSGTSLQGLVKINTQGVQDWTVPATGEYLITVAGGAGGANLVLNYTGGGGAVLSSKVNLSQGTTLKIVVGQKGTDTPANCTYGFCGAAGGGGTFIYESATTTYLAAAGGGGGGASTSANLQTTKTHADGKANSTSGTTISVNSPCLPYSAAGGTNGSGGGASTRTNTNLAGPGAGINSDGASVGNAEGKSRAKGWLGGLMSRTPTNAGGFGGGGASGTWSSGTYLWAGGGGGYSGGGGGFNGGCSDGQYGGGGGSYITGTLQSAIDGGNPGNGYATISLLSAPVISLASQSSASFRTNINLIASSDTAGRITFQANGKNISGCIKLQLTGSASSFSATCVWRPTNRGSISITILLFTSGSSQVSSRNSRNVIVGNRIANR